MKRHAVRIERLERATGINQPVMRLFYLQPDGSIEGEGETFTRAQYDGRFLDGGKIVPVLFDGSAVAV